jgi:hypothetical protein
MKKLLFLVSFLCFIQTLALAQKKNGPWYESTQQLADFKRVKVKGYAELHLIKGEQNQMKVEVKDEGLLYQFRAEINGETLLIKSIRVQAFNPPVRIYLTYKDLEYLQVDGKVNLYSDNVLKTNNLQLDINGYTKTFLNLDVQDLDINVAGYAILNLMGKAERQIIKMDGSGKVFATNLVCNFTKAEISGFANMEVNAQKELRAQVSGVGKVQYVGNPQLSVNRAGLSSVRPID